jgi:hypothetical protein
VTMQEASRVRRFHRTRLQRDAARLCSGEFIIRMFRPHQQASCQGPCKAQVIQNAPCRMLLRRNSERGAWGRAKFASSRQPNQLIQGPGLNGAQDVAGTASAWWCASIRRPHMICMTSPTRLTARPPPGPVPAPLWVSDCPTVTFDQWVDDTRQALLRPCELAPVSPAHDLELARTLEQVIARLAVDTHASDLQRVLAA